MMRLPVFALLGILCALTATGAEPDRFEGHEALVTQTHQASLAAREAGLRAVIAEDAFWIKGAWGDVLWCLSALYVNERVDEANERLLQRANAYVNAMREQATETVFKPEKRSDIVPWAYFALTDYLRILHLFHADSPHHPGRLTAGTEAAMKEAVWWLVKTKSKVKEASLDAILVHHGTENHDLTLRPNYYLAAALFKDDPAFKARRYDDGHIAAEHYAAYNAYFRAWPRQRAMIGLWFEMGSDTYQKYSWPALFNLHELSPDPMVRKHFGMLMDLALVEEAQVAVRGRRGGGRNRAGYGKNSFEGYKNLLYAPAGAGRGASHSKVIETSRYQAPAEAILLRKMAFPAEAPFLIVNRVPGEMRSHKDHTSADDTYNAYTADSALLNYAYRTAHYLLGSTLQDPSLSMTEKGRPVLKYSGISRQNRWSGMLFDDPDARSAVVGALQNRADDEMCAVYPEVEKTRGGRPQHPHWSFQHENVLFLQRIVPGRHGMGSYSTGRMSIRFHGRGLTKVERNGWIFASNGKAHVAVKFLDGGYAWDEMKELAGAHPHDTEATTRILMHAGDIESTDFAAFQTAVLKNPLSVEEDRVVYQSGGGRLECFRYDHHRFGEFKLPRVKGTPIELRPEWTYRSPYLKSRFGDSRVHVRVGPLKRIYDFGAAP